jgi:hypothetical protein
MTFSRKRMGSRSPCLATSMVSLATIVTAGGATIDELQAAQEIIERRSDDLDIVRAENSLIGFRWIG